MFFSRIVVCSSILAVVNAAKLTNTADSYNDVTAGKPLTISWNEASGPVTLLLKSGPSTDLKTVSTIASGQTGNSFVWTPEASLPSGTYALQIDDASGPNYSAQFPIKGSSAQPSSSSVSSSSAYATPSSTMVLPTGYSTGVSSYLSSISSNMTSTMSNSAHATSSYISAIPTSYANYTTSKAPAATTTAPETIPSDTNTATGVTSPVALLMLVLAAIAIMQ